MPPVPQAGSGGLAFLTYPDGGARCEIVPPSASYDVLWERAGDARAFSCYRVHVQRSADQRGARSHRSQAHPFVLFVFSRKTGAVARDHELAVVLSRRDLDDDFFCVSVFDGVGD